MQSVVLVVFDQQLDFLLMKLASANAKLSLHECRKMKIKLNQLLHHQQ